MFATRPGGHDLRLSKLIRSRERVRSSRFSKHDVTFAGKMYRGGRETYLGSRVTRKEDAKSDQILRLFFSGETRYLYRVRKQNDKNIANTMPSGDATLVSRENYRAKAGDTTLLSCIIFMICRKPRKTVGAKQENPDETCGRQSVNYIELLPFHRFR